MLFNSFEFIFFFLPATVTIFFFAASRFQHRVAITWLVVASLFFYGWWNPKYIWLLIFSMLFNYGMGVVLGSRKKKKFLLFIGVTVNMAFLAYFKYTNFFIQNINETFSTNYNVSNIILPLAISFFTFQQIAYLVDAYKNEVREYSFLHYSLFVTFFPQLIAGPIVHHKEMLPQFSIDKTYSLNITNFNLGLTIFVIGLFKKVVLADGIADYSTPVFNAADSGLKPSFFEAWGGACSYTLQLYFDFSGYADMAIGIARIFGISLPLNFNSPYKSINIIEFWRRWHMTLSRFLKEYLYIPLGGNRKGSRYVNLFVTMVLGGFWHGAAWNFIIWGALHGSFLTINHAWREVRRTKLNHNLENNSRMGATISIFVTFLSVIVSWVFFRAETIGGALRMLEGMIGVNGFTLPSSLSKFCPVFLSDIIVFSGRGIGSFPDLSGAIWILSLFAIIFFSPNTQEISTRYVSVFDNKIPPKKLTGLLMSVIPPFIVGLLLFVSLKTMLSVSDSEFLYFNF